MSELTVGWDEYMDVTLTLARIRGIISAHRILNDIDKQMGVDTSQTDVLLDRLEAELGDE